MGDEYFQKKKALPALRTMIDLPSGLKATALTDVCSIADPRCLSKDGQDELPRPVQHFEFGLAGVYSPDGRRILTGSG